MANEKRLIDANALKAHINGVSTHWLNDWSTLGVLAAVDKQPTVDAVEVVRCKDCKHYRNHPNGLCYAWTEPCTNERGYKGEVHCVEPDDFCSYGERSNNEEVR